MTWPVFALPFETAFLQCLIFFFSMCGLDSEYFTSSLGLLVRNLRKGTGWFHTLQTNMFGKCENMLLPWGRGTFTKHSVNLKCSNQAPPDCCALRPANENAMIITQKALELGKPGMKCRIIWERECLNWCMTLVGKEEKKWKGSYLGSRACLFYTQICKHL